MQQRQPSTELAIPTTGDLCRQVIHYAGTDRSVGDSERYDADWQQLDHDNQPLNLRLIQQQLAAGALYTLRVEDATSRQRSHYRITTAPDTVEQTVTGSKERFAWPPSSINHLLLGAFDN